MPFCFRQAHWLCCAFASGGHLTLLAVRLIDAVAVLLGPYRYSAPGVSNQAPLSGLYSATDHS